MMPSGFVPSFNSYGGNVQLIYNFNSYLGFVADFAGYTNGSNPRFRSLTGGWRLDQTVSSWVGGPRVSFWKKRSVSPYVQGLFGGAWGVAHLDYDGVVAIDNTVDPAVAIVAPLRFRDSMTRFAMILGGGVDIRLKRWLALRPAEVSYFMTRFGGPLWEASHPQNNLRYSAGMAFRFGGEQAAPPAPPPAVATKVCPNGQRVPVTANCPKMDLTVSLAAGRTEVCQGESITIVPTIGAQSQSGLRYQWVVDGQAAGQSLQFSVNTTNLSPGQHRVGLTVAGDAFNPASGEITINVLEYRPPTGSLTANPSEIYVGDKSMLSASFTGQCGGPIREPQFTAAEGSVSGSQFDCTGIAFAPGETRKTVNISASAADDRGTGTASTLVTCMQKAAAGAIRLPDILFPANSSRVNNCGKRVLLEQLKSYFDRDPGGKAVVVGYQGENERGANLSQARASNAAAIITAGSDVCLSLPKDQVLVTSFGTNQGGVDFQPNFCGASAVERPGQAVAAGDRMASYRRLVVWFIPSGGDMPASVTSAPAASTLSLGGLGCPK